MAKNDIRRAFEFFQNLLKNQDAPVHYERLREMVRDAPAPIRKAVAQHCAGEKLLSFFRKRQNFFVVDSVYISLAGKTFASNESKDDAGGSRVSRNVAPTASSEKDVEAKLQGDNYATTYFVDMLNKVRNGVFIDKIDFENLPKKTKRHIRMCYKGKLALFFIKYPDIFHVNEEEQVSLANAKVPVDSDSAHLDPYLARAAHVKQAIPEHKMELNSIEGASAYLEGLKFFVQIINEWPSGYPLYKLSTYLKEVPQNVLTLMTNQFELFPDFFLSAPYIFLLNETYQEVSLRRDYDKVLNNMERVLAEFKKGTFSRVNVSIMALVDLSVNPLTRVTNMINQMVINRKKRATNVCDMLCNMQEN